MNSRKILVVEDDESISLTLCQSLIQIDFISWAVDDAVIASELLTKIQFDLILLDIFLPGLNGIEFFAQLKVTRDDLPVIFVSSLCGHDSIISDKVIEMGAVACLGKPVDTGILREIINQVFAEKETQIPLGTE